MKRSSSKLICKASSMRNLNKLQYKLGFDLHIESVDKIIASSDSVVTWERATKVLSAMAKKLTGLASLISEAKFFHKKSLSSRRRRRAPATATASTAATSQSEKTPISSRPPRLSDSSRIQPRQFRTCSHGRLIASTWRLRDSSRLQSRQLQTCNHGRLNTST